jgi:hypothetical protein
MCRKNLVCARGPVRWAQTCDFFLPYLQYDGQDTGDNPEQGHTFHEGGRQDHVRADVTGSFRLAGDAFNSATANLTDADASAKGSQAGADGATGLSQTRVSYSISLEQNCVQQRHVTMDLGERKNDGEGCAVSAFCFYLFQAISSCGLM